MVFKGETAEGAETLSFDVKPHIVYPMEGGTAFITFEEVDGEYDSQSTLSLDFRNRHLVANE